MEGLDDCDIDFGRNEEDVRCPVEGERYERLGHLEKQEGKKTESHYRFSWKAFKEYLARLSMIE